MGENDRGAPSDQPEHLLPPPVGEVTAADTAVLSEYFSEESLLVLGDWAPALKAKKDVLEERMQLEEAILHSRQTKEQGGPNLIMRFLEASPRTASIFAHFSETVSFIKSSPLTANDNRTASELFEMYKSQKDRIIPLTPIELDGQVTMFDRSLHRHIELLAEVEEVLTRLVSLIPNQEGYDEVLKELAQKVGPPGGIRFGAGPLIYFKGMIIMSKFAQLEHEENGHVGRISARFVNEGVDPQYEEEIPADPDSPKWRFGSLRELWRQHAHMMGLAAKATPYPRLAELQALSQNLMDEQRSRLIADYLFSGRCALEAAEITRHEMEAEVEDTEFPYSIFDFENGEDVAVLMRLVALNRVPHAEQLRNELTRFLTTFGVDIPPAYSYIRDGWTQLASQHDWRQRIARLRSEVKAGVAPRLERHMDDVAGRYKALLGVVEGRKPRVRGGKSGRSAKQGGKPAPPTAEELTATAFTELYDMREATPEDHVAGAPKGERIFDPTEAALLSVLVSGGWEEFNAAHRALKREHDQIIAFAELSQCVVMVENHPIALGAKFDISEALRAVKDKIEQHDLRELKHTVEEQERSAALMALFKIWQPLIRRGVRLGG